MISPNQTNRFDGRIAGVDGLRGVAVLLVILNHFVETQLPREIGTWQAYVSAGLGLSFSGVDLFFVISGYLIGGILMDNKEATNFYHVFYVRRVLRIVPIYYLFLLFCWVLPKCASSLNPMSYPLGSYLTFLCNFWMAAFNTWDAGWPALAWSLSVEEQFYLLIPFVVRFCSRAALVKLSIAAVLMAPVLRILMLKVAPQWSLATHIMAPCRIDSLALGILVACGVRDGKIRDWFERHSSAPGLAVLALTPGLAYLTLSRVPPQSLEMAAFGYTILGLFYSSLLLTILVRRPNGLMRVFESKVLMFIGCISYFVYLFQGMIGWAVFRAFGREHITLLTWTDGAIVSLALMVIGAAGALSWVLFESRLIAVGRHLRYS